MPINPILTIKAPAVGPNPLGNFASRAPLGKLHLRPPPLLLGLHPAAGFGVGVYCFLGFPVQDLRSNKVWLMGGHIQIRRQIT